jgi:hypothetical protein
MTIDELREFVRTSPWKFASTMPEIPHEYTLRVKSPDEKNFERVVLYIRQAGYRAEFGSATYTYLDIDGWKYWTMGAALGETILINRAKLEPSD